MTDNDSTKIINRTFEIYHDCGWVFDCFTITLFVLAILGLMLNVLLLHVCLGFFRCSRCCRRKNNFTRESRNLPTIISRPQYAFNCFVFNGALAAILAAGLQTIRAVANTFYGGDIILILQPADQENVSIHYRRLSQALMFMSTFFGPFAVAHFNFIFLLNAEKLFYILKPLQYYNCMNKKGRSIAACLSMWSFSFAWIPIMFAEKDEQKLNIETVLVGLLYLCPTVFGLVTATIVAVTVHRILSRDRRNRGRLVDDRGEIRSRNRLPNRSSAISFRSFRGVAWTTIFSLPHPCVRIILYCLSKDANDFLVTLNKCPIATATLVVVNFSVSNLLGIPIIVICTHPAYRYRTKAMMKNIMSGLINKCRYGRAN